MNTGLTIEWTAEAQNKLNVVFDYLENHWTSHEVKKFAKRLDEALSFIIKFPFIYPASTQNNMVRRCVLTRQISLYYKVNPTKILIITLFDNRQNPASLKVI
ncbi:MAG: type II toxin-antitoxin system RelE/ParE family toxin [Prevotellaceae bacterium]|jgi:plasmid stabilization system protein ParE|nr:type II toxin-antitoxin system RelE/ParE family toxin [Prevotellaceae bacterium]